MRPNPDGKRLPSTGFDGDNMYMNENNHEFLPPNQSYTGQTGGGGGGGGGGGSGSGNGDEDYEIPPITPPNHPEPPLLHLMEHDSTGYLCHSLQHNGLINPYSYPELPTLMMSNMLAQDSHLVSSQMPSQSIYQSLDDDDLAIYLRALCPCTHHRSVPQAASLTAMQEMALHHHQQQHQHHHHHHPDGAHYDHARTHSLINSSPPILPNPMSALTQLNPQVSRSALPHGSPSPPGSKSATPSPSSSNQEEETDPHSKMVFQITGEKRPSSEMMKPKPKPQKKKKKKDPNEPTKPVSAYALFFRDTQAAIKGQNPNATFGDVSKIVASMWDGLGEEQKQSYKRKTEAAKKEYLKALAAYRASLVSKTYNDPVDTKSGQSGQGSPHMMPANPPLYSVPPPPQPSSPYLGPGAFPLTDLQSYAGHAPRHALSQTLSQSQMLPSISASPPSSFQISPPLHPHQQLSLHQSSLLNQPIRMQQVQSQPIISHQMGLQASLHSPPPGQQGFSHLQSEYQKSIGGSQSPGAPGPGPGPGVAQSHDWDSEYCNRECGNHCSGSMIGRDKPLYLT
ncbi:TOX high mobility group box family member 2 isoform X5 [Sebastes umbrosus]|nr:TOX high mobility group box family member 2 isoform X5 [Sebastes umbrosus]XP_037625684.1 TOX high mobility group box family member 2 isoform X5 [Sebastes umbrosus]XP_037625690.1 TOX high mobility group box family member 2 isoform X5 [Sebastes umbrosus]